MPQPITLPVVTDACQIVNCQIFSKRSRSPRGSLWFWNGRRSTRNTFPFRFTIPPASLDPSVPWPGPYLLPGLPGLLESVASSPFVETFVASSEFERNVVVFGEIRRESVKENSLKCFVSREFFKVCSLNLLIKRVKFHIENRCQG